MLRSIEILTLLAIITGVLAFSGWAPQIAAISKIIFHVALVILSFTVALRFADKA